MQIFSAIASLKNLLQSYSPSIPAKHKKGNQYSYKNIVMALAIAIDCDMLQSIA
jgi:hypothetical protein